MAGFLCQISKKYSEEAPSIFAEIASKKVISIGARTRIDSKVVRHVWRQGQSAETTSQFEGRAAASFDDFRVKFQPYAE
jgi:hypothetical protein